MTVVHYGNVTKSTLKDSLSINSFNYPYRCHSHIYQIGPMKCSFAQVSRSHGPPWHHVTTFLVCHNLSYLSEMVIWLTMLMLLHCSGLMLMLTLQFSNDFSNQLCFTLLHVWADHGLFYPKPLLYCGMFENIWQSVQILKRFKKSSVILVN